MDHPLISPDQSDLRRRAIQLLSTAYSVPRVSNIVFVCGGNESHHLRTRFRTYCEANLQNYHVLFPEAAMSSFFSGTLEEPFDISDFEELIGQLSQAIVIFPEAAGSYAETGYFSAIENLRKQAILVLDTKYQGTDSFISLGPAKKIGSNSLYQPNINLDYNNTNFDIIATRIKRLNIKKYKKSLIVHDFSKLHNFDLFSLIHGVVDLLTIATVTDIVFMLRAMSQSHVSVPSVRKLISILVGSEYLLEVGSYGHLSVNRRRTNLLGIRDGFRNDHSEIKLILLSLFESGDPEFKQLVEVSRHAA